MYVSLAATIRAPAMATSTPPPRVRPNGAVTTGFAQ
jgi:hypothetical protein